MPTVTTYSAGTVTVTAGSRTVTASGSQWLFASVQGGDIFETAGLTATIESVQSDTSLTLRRNWPGASASGAAYEIRFIADNVRVMASARSIIAQVDGLSSTVNADITAADTRLTGQITDIDSKYSQALQTRDADLSADLAALETRLRGEITTSGSLSSSDLDALDARLSADIVAGDDAVRAVVGALDTRLTGEIADLDTRLTTLDGETSDAAAIQALDDKLTAADAQLSSNIGALDTRLTGEVNAVETAVATAQARAEAANAPPYVAFASYSAAQSAAIPADVRRVSWVDGNHETIAVRQAGGPLLGGAWIEVEQRPISGEWAAGGPGIYKSKLGASGASFLTTHRFRFEDDTSIVLAGGTPVGSTYGLTHNTLDRTNSGSLIHASSATAANEYWEVRSGGSTFLRLYQTIMRAVSDAVYDLGHASFRFRDIFALRFRPGAGAVIWTSGVGSPEGVVSAPVGSLYTRSDGGTNTTLYVKQIGGGGNTGWAAK